MHYTYHKPVAERHQVDWYLRSSPGLVSDEKRELFTSLKLRPELVEWLDANAPGWSFRSDWDYANGGGDDEGCHLTVHSEAEGQGFVEIAKRLSREWIEADHAAMRVRIHLVRPDGSTEEVVRAHDAAGLYYQIERPLGRKHGLAERRYAICAEHDAIAAVRSMLVEGGDTRDIPFRLRPGEEVPAEAHGFKVRVEILPASEEK